MIAASLAGRRLAEGESFYWVYMVLSMVGRGEAERWKTGAAVLGAIAAVVTVALGLWQLKEANALQEEENQLQQAQFDSHLNEVMMGIDRHFVSHPKLRPFFYSPRGRSLPLREPLRAQALGTAEMIVDFASDVSAYAQKHRMGSHSSAQWAGIIRGYFVESPAVRFVWRSFRDVYDEPTACILGAPYNEKDFSRWQWRTNAPVANWPKDCD